MQSLASLMSMKQSDIGNLDDFNDSDDEAGEDRRGSFGTGHATPVTGKAGDTLEDHWGFKLNEHAMAAWEEILIWGFSWRQWLAESALY